MSNNEGIPLHGDRGAWNVVDHAAEHAKDISDGTLLRHLPEPGTENNIAVDNGTSWVSGTIPSHNHTESDITDLEHVILFYDEGVLAGTVSVVNVTGDGGTVSVTGGTATLNITGGGDGGGGSVTFYDEGNLAGTVSIMNFTGDGVTATYSDGTAIIDISGTVLAEVAVYDEGVIAGTVSIFNFTGDGGTVSVSGGTAVVNITGGGGSVGWGNIFELTEPDLDEFAWVNQGSATATESGGKIYLYDPANASVSYRILKKTAPSTPYTITALLIPNSIVAAYPSVGIGWRQSSDGKLILCRLIGMGSTHNLAILKATNETTDSANYIDVALGAIPYMWLRITDNGTNRIVSFSRDGENFIQMHSVGRTDFLTADEVCFFISSRNATYAAGVIILSWEET